MAYYFTDNIAIEGRVDWLPTLLLSSLTLNGRLRLNKAR